MTEPSSRPRIALLGWGAIGQRVQAALRDRWMPDAEIALFARPSSAERLRQDSGLSVFTDVAALAAWQPRLAIECAGHAVVAEVLPPLLRAGIDVMIASVGALGSATLREDIESAARIGGARPLVVSGAIGGLDALRAARQAGLDSVRYTGRKPPLAWRGTPAEQCVDLGAITEATVIFEGCAADAARDYPKNANVTAAVALAGIGFERTAVRLVADPGVSANVHELDAQGAFGTLQLRLQNAPLPDNPKSSWLAALSIEATLASYFHPQSLF